ncbi:MAG: hypothetical protein IIX12_02955, partial [Alistipes sp.]|nr:hypothetical protein [Alistipes sp.]
MTSLIVLPLATTILIKSLIVIGIMLLLGWFIHQKILQIKYHKSVQQLQPAIRLLQHKYLEIFQPTRMVVSSDFDVFKSNNKLVLEEIEQLSRHRFFDQAI